MLDWSKIDNDKKFQDLVNDVFAWEINKPGLKPSSAYIGADGGWDGRYDGEYLGETGLFSFQAKWTTKTLKNAVTPLSTAIKGNTSSKGELTKAKENDVNFLYVVTNAELNVGDHVPTLENLKTVEVDKLYVYHRAKLAQLIELYPWIQHKYFGLPTKPLFCPTDVYFEYCEPQLFLDSDILGFKREIVKVTNFLQSNNKILTLTAPAGRGKTRLLHHLANDTVPGLDDDWIPLFCRTSLRSIEDALNDEILDTKKYVIFVDNADLTPEKTTSLFEAVRYLDPSRFKLILTCRSENSERVTAEIERLRFSDYIVIPIEPLPFEDQIKLLEVVSKKEATDETKKLVKGLDDNLHSIIQYGLLLTGEDTVQPEDINKHIVSEQIESAQVLKGLGFSTQEIKKLLIITSVNVPLKAGNRRLTETISAQIGKETDVVIKAFEELTKSGVLRVVGSSHRFATDLKGNVFLASLIDSDLFTLEMIKEWLELNPKEVSYNLGISYIHNKSDRLKGFVKTIVDQLTSEIATGKQDHRISSLDWLANVAHIVPKEVLNCLFALFDTTTDEINRDYYGPILTSLVVLPVFQKETLQLIDNIANRETKGFYNNYEPQELITQAVSPISTRNIDNSIHNLQVLESWTERENLSQPTLSLILEGVKEALAGSHKFTQTEGVTITYGHRGLVYGPKVEEYRNTAMLVIDKLLKRNEGEVTKKAIELLNNIGSESYSKEGELWDKILAEKTQFLDWVADLLSDRTLDVRIASEIEDQLFRLWGNNHIYPTLESKVQDLLRAIPKTPELQIYKLITNSDFVVSDNAQLIESAPDQEVWSWLVHNHMHRFQSHTDILVTVVKRLGEKYQDVDTIVGFLKDLNDKITETHWGYVPIIETWFATNKDVILKIATSPKLLSQVPQRFKQGFEIVASKNVPDYIVGYADALLKKEQVNPTECDQFLDLIKASEKTPNIFIPWVRALVPKLDKNGTRILLNRLSFLIEKHSIKDKQEMINLFQEIVEADTNGEFVDVFDFVLHQLQRDSDFDRFELDGLKTTLYESAVTTRRFDYHQKTVVDYILDKNIESLINLIDARLRYKENTDVSYDAIPFDGFNDIGEYIKNYADYHKFMNKIASWLDDDLLYSFQVDTLTQYLHQLKDEQGHYQTRYIEEKLKSEDLNQVKQAIASLHGLFFGADTGGLFLEALNQTSNTELYEDAENAFISRVVSGSFSGTIGEVPTEWTRKLETLKELKKQAPPGKIYVLVESLERQVEQDIKKNLEEAEEILNPKD